MRPGDFSSTESFRRKHLCVSHKPFLGCVSYFGEKLKWQTNALPIHYHNETWVGYVNYSPLNFQLSSFSCPRQHCADAIVLTELMFHEILWAKLLCYA